MKTELDRNNLNLSNSQKAYFIEREPIFQQLVSEEEIIDVKWIFPKNPTFIGFHNEYEIHFFKKGEGVYYIGGRKCEVERNHIVIIKPKQIHYFIPKKGTQIEKGTLYFTPNLFRIINSKKFPQNFPCSFQVNEDEAIIIEMIFKFLLKEKKEKNIYWDEIVKAQLKILILLIKRIGRQNKQKHIVSPLVKKIIEYIEKNFRNHFSIQKMANDLQISISHLAHTFKQNMGLTIKQYLLQRRIAEAKFIIENQPYVKMSVVGEKVGFSNFSLFNRTFKKMVGMSPSAYQKIALYKE